MNRIRAALAACAAALWLAVAAPLLAAEALPDGASLAEQIDHWMRVRALGQITRSRPLART